MTVATLREQMQMARINRTKARVAAWWKAGHCQCPNCVLRRAGAASEATGVPLVDLLRSMGANVQILDLGKDDTGGPADHAPPETKPH